MTTPKHPAAELYAEELAQKAALEASQKADSDRAVAELGTLLPDLGYTGWTMGNGYFAIYDSDPFALLGTESARLLFTGRLDEVRRWLESRCELLGQPK